ncbi:sugar-binding transcriptional regulator [Actinomyces radicidentis]|uniref:sugar-binding transcriptional regulator n=1 Tax=Actinomyces radicidentis TaxID=111015 RepID=UPI0026E0251C|nr:sugar-binding domain-containing protein [Actinomyces radicidentis]
MDDVGSALTHKDVLALDVARLYHEAGLTQAEVAERVHLSRPTVSKLLSYAQRRGFVRIEVWDPREHDEAVIAALLDRFDLTEVRLVATHPHLPGQARAALAAQGADLLTALVRDGDVVAVQGSAVLADVVRCLAPAHLRSVRVVQMARSLSECLTGREETSSPALLASTLGAQATPLPCPLIAPSVPEANRLRSSSPLREALALIPEARVAVFTATSAERFAPLTDRLGLSQEDAESLRHHAAGELCARIIDADGCVCLPDLNNRTLGVSLTELRHIEQKVLLACGRDCAPVVRAALSSGYVDRLVVDVATARQVLALDAA